MLSFKAELENCGAGLQIVIHLYDELGMPVVDAGVDVIQNVETVTEEDVKSHGIALLASYAARKEAEEKQATELKKTADSVQEILDKVNNAKVTAEDVAASQNSITS